MLLEILDDKVITMDEKPIIKDLRVNFPKGRNALRAKFKYIDDTVETPVDLVVYEYSNPRLDKVSSIAIDIDGKEFNKNIPFRVKLSINIIHRRFNLSGYVGGKNIEKESDSIPGLLPDIMKLFV